MCTEALCNRNSLPTNLGTGFFAAASGLSYNTLQKPAVRYSTVRKISLCYRGSYDTSMSSFSEVRYRRFATRRIIGYPRGEMKISGELRESDTTTYPVAKNRGRSYAAILHCLYMCVHVRARLHDLQSASALDPVNDHAAHRRKLREI